MDLLRKFVDKECLHEVVDFGIISFNECCVKCLTEFELNGYFIKQYVIWAILLCFIKSG